MSDETRTVRLKNSSGSPGYFIVYQIVAEPAASSPTSSSNAEPIAPAATPAAAAPTASPIVVPAPTPTPSPASSPSLSPSVETPGAGPTPASEPVAATPSTSASAPAVSSTTTPGAAPLDQPTSTSGPSSAPSSTNSAPQSAQALDSSVVAWLVLGCNPDCYATFEWKEEGYSLGWVSNVNISKNVRGVTGGEVVTNLKGYNVDFGKSGPSRAIGFGQAKPGDKGTITAKCDKTIRIGECDIALMKSGKVVTTKPAIPNSDVSFSTALQPQYYVVFGTEIKIGEPVNKISSTCPAQLIPFAGTDFESFALTGNNTWISVN